MDLMSIKRKSLQHRKVLFLSLRKKEKLFDEKIAQHIDIASIQQELDTALAETVELLCQVSDKAEFKEFAQEEMEGFLIRLLEYGANPCAHRESEKQEPLLMTACGKYGVPLRDNVLRIFLEKGALKDINFQDEKLNTPTLVLAERLLVSKGSGYYVIPPDNPCVQSMPEVQKSLLTLLSFNPDVNLENTQGTCVLMEVVPFYDLVKEVLRLGANPNHADKYGFTPLISLANSGWALDDKGMICQELVLAGADPLYGLPIRYLASDEWSKGEKSMRRKLQEYMGYQTAMLSTADISKAIDEAFAGTEKIIAETVDTAIKPICLVKNCSLKNAISKEVSQKTKQNG